MSTGGSMPKGEMSGSVLGVPFGMPIDTTGMSADLITAMMERMIPPSKEDIFARWDETNKQLKRIADLYEGYMKGVKRAPVQRKKRSKT